VLVEQKADNKTLDAKRLLDCNDDYEEILFYGDREVRLIDGEYKLARPESKVEATELEAENG